MYVISKNMLQRLTSYRTDRCNVKCYRKTSSQVSFSFSQKHLSWVIVFTAVMQ